METNSVPRQLVCESCGASFGCSPFPNSGCWCMDLKIEDSALEEVRAKFANCICPECLVRLAKAEAAARA